MAYNLDQSYTTGQDNNEGGLIHFLRIAADNTQIIGQSFTPTLTGKLNKVDLYLKKVGTPTGNLWIQIHEDGANPASATQLGSASALVDISTIGTGAYEWVSFTFATGITLSPATEYWILLFGDNTYGTTNSVFWGTDTSSPAYAGGISGRYGNGSLAWEDQSYMDALFRQYSDNPAGGVFLNLLI